MIYLDTSAIAPFYWPEDLSDRVVNVLRQEPDRTISDLTAVEFYSALRALDALHLAIANDLNRCLVTADNGLAKSAQTLNIPFQHLSLE